jgi:hypothetical protein
MPNPTPKNNPAFAEKIKKSKDAAIDLAKTSLCVKLPIAVDEAIRALGDDRSVWMRRVLTEAAKKELIDKMD